MASKSVILSLFLIVSSSLHVGFSGDNMQCIEKLLPCQPYLKSSPSPSGTCCQPLMDMIAKDADCLCKMFNNPQMLQSMNVTKDEALELPKACGADADVSKCKKDSSSPSDGSETSPADKESNSTDSKSSINKITPRGATQFGVCGFTALIVALAFSA